MNCVNSNKEIAQAGQSRAYVCVSWLLVIAWAAVIFYMSSNSGSDLNEELGLLSSIFQALKDLQTQLLGEGVEVITSIAHFCEYAVLGVLLINALHCHMSLSRALLIAVACASLYGVSDEFHQLFVPGRMCDPVDWVVDTAGALLGAWVGKKLLTRYALRLR